MSSSPPAVVADRYRLVAPLGQGGMGRVWRATDVVLHREVAIKELVPPPGLTAGERQEMRERSLREARAIARLNNVNVVRVFDVLRTDADPWIVMEYVPSRSLQDTLAADGPFSPVRAAEMGLGVLGALRAAHRAGVVHRDVKPGNVLIGADGRVVLTDFGLATVPGDPNVTRTGLVLGSPAYIAPERARDGTAGPAADLWSLGATLYAAVEGVSPFARPSAIATLTALATENPPPARNAGPLKPVLNGLLRKDPTHRINAEEAERLLNRAAGRRSKLSFPMSPTMRRPGAGRDRSALGGAMSPTGSAPVVPGPRPPVAPARPVDPPGRPPVSGGRPAAGEGRPPVFAPGKAPVGRPAADTPTKADGPRIDATRVDTPPVKDDKTTVMRTRDGSPTAGAQPPATRLPTPNPSTRTNRGQDAGFTAADVAANRRGAAAPEHEQSLADATALVKGPPADKTTVVAAPEQADATTLVAPPAADATTVVPPAKPSPRKKAPSPKATPAPEKPAKDAPATAEQPEAPAPEPTSDKPAEPESAAESAPAATKTSPPGTVTKKPEESEESEKAAEVEGATAVESESGDKTAGETEEDPAEDEKSQVHVPLARTEPTAAENPSETKPTETEQAQTEQAKAEQAQTEQAKAEQAQTEQAQTKQAQTKQAETKQAQSKAAQTRSAEANSAAAEAENKRKAENEAEVEAVAPVSPVLNRPNRPVWRPMEPRPATAGITVFGTRLTYWQAAVGAGIILLVLALVITLVAQSIGGGDDKPTGKSTAAGPAATTPAVQPTGSAGTPSTTPSSATSAPSSPATSAATDPGAVTLPKGWAWRTFGATGDSPGFKIALPTKVEVRGGGQEIRFSWDNRLLILGRTKSPQADAYTDWQNQEKSRRGSYRDYNSLGISRVTYRDFESVADWEFTYTTDKGNPQHVIRRNIRVNKNAAFSLNWYVSTSDWDASQANLQLLYQSFQPQ